MKVLPELVPGKKYVPGACVPGTGYKKHYTGIVHQVTGFQIPDKAKFNIYFNFGIRQKSHNQKLESDFI
jgi:hypothetical protein